MLSRYIDENLRIEGTILRGKKGSFDLSQVTAIETRLPIRALLWEIYSVVGTAVLIIVLLSWVPFSNLNIIGKCIIGFLVLVLVACAVGVWQVLFRKRRIVLLYASGAKTSVPGVIEFDDIEDIQSNFERIRCGG